MTTGRKIKITFGLLSVGLLTTLLFKLTNVPGGMMIAGIILGCLLLTGIIRLLFKRTSFMAIFFITTSIFFIAFHYHLYSPSLTIKVPNGYKGEINLVLSKLDENILTVDSNGIGYLTEWNFNKTYTRPKVEQIDGKNLDAYLIGFNPSTFFGKGKSCCIRKQEVQSLSFKIGTKPNLEDEYFGGRNLTETVDTNKAILMNLDKYSTVGETTIKVLK